VAAQQKTAENTHVTMQNLQVIKDLEPAELWEHFVKLSSIPHCSGSETQSLFLLNS